MDNETPKVSRRSFLKRGAAGAAAAAALATAPSLLVVAERSGGGGTLPDGVTTPLVAFVRDAAKGEVVIMFGSREVVRRDPGLVARLVAMAG